MSCPAPTITAEQRSAMKPWAIGIFAAEVLMLASMVLLAIFPRAASDIRIFGIWISLTWLTGRGCQTYCQRRMATIAGEPYPPTISTAYLPYLLSFRRTTTAVVLTILVASIVAFFL